MTPGGGRLGSGANRGGSRLAGHADGGATALKHYIRVRPGDLEAARDAIAALLGARAHRGGYEKV